MTSEGYITLDNVVRSHLFSKGEDTLHGYLPALKFALDGLKKINMDGSREIKTVMLVADSNNTVKFPSDMLTYTKVGIKYGDRIYTYPNDSTLSRHFDTSEIYPEPNTPYSPAMMAPAVYQYEFLNYLDIFGDFTAVTGIGWGHNGQGYFTPDWQSRLFIFSGDLKQNEVYLEYKTDGTKVNTQTEVSEHVEMALQAYMGWQESRYALGDASKETAMRKREWFSERDQSNALSNSIDAEDIRDVLRRTTEINK